MIVLAMLAASFVVSVQADASPNASLLASETSRPESTTPSCFASSADESAVEPSRRGAKHIATSPLKSGIHAAKETSRGRVLAAAAIKVGAVGDDTLVEDDDAVAAMSRAPTRESAYVCPSDMVMLGRSYCIDRYEASLLQVHDDGSESAWPYFQTLPADVVVRAVSVAGVYPQGYVSGLEARSACERSGKRLCSPDEWKSACVGPKKTIFPYGNEREAGRCNDNGRSSMRFFNPDLDDKPEHRWMWGFGGNMIDPRLNQLEGTLTRTGERADCTNEYGVFDMVGNLHEWVDDPDGTFQGGYYLDTHLNGDGCYYRTTAHPISHFDYSTGFRCCADVAPL